MSVHTTQVSGRVFLTSRTAHTIGVSAGLTAVVNLLALLVALLLIGPAALVDRTLLTELALRNPTPILIQDGLKLASAALSAVLLGGFFRWLRPGSPRVVTIGTLFGGLSVLCLLGNTVLSFVATRAAAEPMSVQGQEAAQVGLAIGVLALGAIMLNGVWYLIIHWTARKKGVLPRGLAMLGLVIGGLSLLPPLGLIVLVLTIVWSFWLSGMMLRARRGE